MTSTFSLENATEINIPDFYVLCPPEHSNKREQLLSATSVKQRQIDFDCVKKYIMTTIQTSPYRTLVLKQALKVIYKNLFSFLIFDF